MSEWILGIWDGHDAGCALIRDNEIHFAINEERLTRRKLEVGFPRESIKRAISECGLAPSDIARVAFTTSDFAKTLSRVFPSMQEEYYLLRRKKKFPTALNRLKKLAKYRITEIPSNWLTRALSRRVIARRLADLGIHPRPDSLTLVPHHASHAAAAAFCSGYDRCLVLTIDGIGDGLSGTVSTFRGGKLNLLSEISGTSSLGIFFEHVTNLLNMRELEDEGKVMALANYTYPIPDTDNPLLHFFSVQGLSFEAKYGSAQAYRELNRILWRVPSEQFAYMAQRTLELKVLELVRNAVKVTCLPKIAYAGGVASNVKLNMLIRELPEVESLFVFPHMGDGGQAIGAAIWDNFQANGVTHYPVRDVFWGSKYSRDQIQSALGKFSEFTSVESNKIWEDTADLLSRGEIVMWFQGRMEFGPRALGGRSILALPNSTQIRDDLNLRLKKRAWYQPYCPVMLHEDAKEILDGYDGVPNPFMTCAYRTRVEKRDQVCGVIGVDGTCRPQILDGTGNNPYTQLLQAIKRRTGVGVLLNTSFNLHGEPVVCSPEDALRTFKNTDAPYLVLGNFLVSKRSG